MRRSPREELGRWVNLDAAGEVLVADICEGWVEFTNLRVLAPAVFDLDNLPEVWRFKTTCELDIDEWCDVISRVSNRQQGRRSASERISTAKAARQLGIDQGTLRQMADEAPATLPGAPVRTGGGTQRLHLRWDPARLAEFRTAYTDWKRRQESEADAAPTPRRPPERHARRRKRGSRLSLYQRAKQNLD